jgi:hypothetical protein
LLGCPAPEWRATVGFKFALVTDGEVFDSFETAVPDWSAGDTVIAAGNVHYRVASVIAVELAAEYVDGPLNGLLEVERL